MTKRLSADQAFRELVLCFEVAESKAERSEIMAMIREFAEKMIEQGAISPEILEVIEKIQSNPI